MQKGVGSIASYNIYQHFLPQFFLVREDISLPGGYCLTFAHPNLFGNLKHGREMYTNSKLVCTGMFTTDDCGNNSLYSGSLVVQQILIQTHCTM